MKAPEGSLRRCETGVNPNILQTMDATLAEQDAVASTKTTPPACRLGIVSFLNARPLAAGLLDHSGVTLHPAVPSRLAEMLVTGDCDVGLLPIVDYYRNRRTLVSVSNACIASDGETMTVRVFSRVPPDQIKVLHADGDSHTSVILAQVLWREMYGSALMMEPHRGMTGSPPDAVLLIGDKVVCESPRGYGFEVDLGAAWKHLTGLPFVFAAWFGQRSVNHGATAALLEASRDAGVKDVEAIAARFAPQHRWPSALALTYLRDIMRYTLTSEMRLGMDRFFALSERHGLLS